MRVPLIQILPLRTAHPEGVGDYARLLAERLRDAHGFDTRFITGTPTPHAERRYDEWPTFHLPRRRAVTLLRVLNDYPVGTRVLLHLASYGYQKRGVPFWLLSTLRHWRAVHPNTLLITLFHEISAKGPITTSAFWLGPMQAAIARRMQALSSAVVTTSQMSRVRLADWAVDPTQPVLALPVFSTIGEPRWVPPATKRQPVLVVFGRESVFAPTYVEGRKQLAALADILSIDEIVDIGPRPSTPPARVGRAVVRVLGEINAGQLGEELLRARYGLLHYDADRLAKSTVFAAYASHGAVAIVVTAQQGCCDGLRPGMNYIYVGPGHMPSDVMRLEQLQQSALRWYEGHSLDRSAAIFARLLA